MFFFLSQGEICFSDCFSGYFFLSLYILITTFFPCYSLSILYSPVSRIFSVSLITETFLLFFLGNIISLIGFGFNLIAISWLVLEETGSEFALGKIMAAATTPVLILALVAGIIIDRVNRKWLLVKLDILRAIVLIAFIYYIKLEGFSLLILYPVMMLMGLGNSLFWPTAQAFVQTLQKKTGLLAGKCHFHVGL